VREGRASGRVGGEVLGRARGAVGLERAHLDLEAVERLGGRDAHAHAESEHAAALRKLEAGGGAQVDIVELRVQVGLDAALGADVGRAADGGAQLDGLVVIVEERERAW
jgi:hypothetical protein